jgi:acylphosphatase
MNGVTGLIRGRVQGVGFRYFTQNLAKTLNLTGWVRNLHDESVEIMAVGDRENLERLLLKLKAGSIGSRVDDWDFQWLSDQTPFKGFEIRS